MVTPRSQNKVNVVPYDADERLTSDVDYHTDKPLLYVDKRLLAPIRRTILLWEKGGGVLIWTMGYCLAHSL